MNKYFKDAVERYGKKFKDKKFFISPISNKDANIIGYLKAILTTLEAPSSLLEILDRYKSESDEVILNEVETWIIDNPSAGNDLFSDSEEDELDAAARDTNRSLKFISIRGLRLKLNYIYSYEPYDNYDGKGELDSFCILLNKMPEDAKRVPTFANTLIKFYSEEERDEGIIKIDKWLKDNNVELLK